MEKFLHKLAEIFTHEGGIVTWCVCTIGSLLSGYEGRIVTGKQIGRAHV